MCVFKEFSRKMILALVFTATTSIFADCDENKSFVLAHTGGRLGNLFFQVAAASALAWDNDAEPCVPLDINATTYRHIFFRFNQTRPQRPVTYEWRDDAFSYVPMIYQPDMKLFGCFQSEKWFVHHRERLLEMFSPHPNDLSYMKARYPWIFSNPNTVGVQIRYYRNESTPEGLYPQYGRDYLEKAMAMFPESSVFVVSTDDLAFARKNIPHWAKNVVFLENERDYIELYLLSYCKHNIITNSSFGWWGAWLNQNLDKVVVRPALWLGQGYPTQDVCPQEWIVIDAQYE